MISETDFPCALQVKINDICSSSQVLVPTMTPKNVPRRYDIHQLNKMVGSWQCDGPRWHRSDRLAAKQLSCSLTRGEVTNVADCKSRMLVLWAEGEI